MSKASRKVVVWDVSTRLFHWIAAALVVAAYVTLRLNWMDWHARAGDALLALIVFRILWGFFGSETARFSRFLAPPRVAMRYLAAMFRREPDWRAGHNPAGGWMVVAFLAVLLGETLTGRFVANDIADEGPLSALVPASVDNAISALHAILWDAILAAVALHLLAILVYAVAKGHNLLLPMITGRKSLPANVPQPRIVGLLRAAFLLACSALISATVAEFL